MDFFLHPLDELAAGIYQRSLSCNFGYDFLLYFQQRQGDLNILNISATDRRENSDPPPKTGPVAKRVRRPRSAPCPAREHRGVAAERAGVRWLGR